MSNDPPPPSSRDDFEVAVICTLGPAGNAVEALFDKVWQDAGNTIGWESSDTNAYTVGLIGRHYVVLTWIPGMGKIHAAVAASHLRFSFTKIKHVLVVGICSGVPREADGEEILLGDVIISTAVKKYDSGKQYFGGYQKREEVYVPNPEMRSFLAKLGASSSLKRLREASSGYLEELLNKEDFLKARYPGVQEDKLFEPTYLHKHHGVSSCGVCTEDEGGVGMVCDDATNLTCMELKCDESLLVPRSRLEQIKKAAAVEAAKAPNPAIHFGVIGSGDTVMKSAKHRDLVAKRERVIAFEMEAAGVFAMVPSVVAIIGVCDYADSHRNKKWQAYAAVTAAAYMKAFLKMRDEALGMPKNRLAEQFISSTPTYRKLGGGEIRLVILRCGEVDAPIEVQLRILSFDDKAKYDALSYSVGTRGKSAIINLRHDGQREELHVSARLESILRHLRGKNEDRVLWVDALSINQADFEERAREVRRLGKIFAAAQNVYIWLGEAADDSDLAMDFIPDILNFGAFDKLVRDETRKLHWLALAKLMAREWFTRRWVVQEMALARNAIVFCGDRQIPWSDLAHAAALFGTKWQEIVLWLPPMEAFMLGDAQTPGATSLVELSSNIFRKDSSTQRLERRLGIEVLLDLLPMFDVTVPLDSVYSLIDIAHDTYETDKIKVDYNLEPRELFANVIKLIVENSKSLDVICRPWAPVCDLPSWITTIADHAFERRGDGQYFRQNADSLVGSPGRSIYRASGNNVAECQFELDTKTNIRMLKCSGLPLGRVKATGGRGINGIIPREWRRLAGWSDRSQPVPEAFWRTLVADRGPGGVSPPNWYEKACEYSFRRGRTDIDISQLISISTSSNEQKFLQRVETTMWNRVFFTVNVTGKHGDRVCFGLGPAKIAVGDDVVILCGCSVPVVLRRRQEPHDDIVYELVGETFVYGFMDGEAIMEWRKGSFHLSKFSVA